MSEPDHIAVVGAGPAGLTAALRLQQGGARVTVLEAQDWLGGRTRTDELDGARVDAGAQLFGSMYTRLLALTAELGLGDHLVRAPGRDALWRDGRAHEVAYGSVASMLASGALPMRTKLRLGATYLPFLTAHASALDLHAPERAAAAGLDAESIAAWGVRTLDRAFVELLVYPQMAAYYGALPEETSAGFYHQLARHALDVSLYALRGGTGALCGALAERVRAAGGEVRLRAPVERVEVEGAGVALHAAAGAERFDGAVLAAPAPVARALLGDTLPRAREWLEGVRYRPAMTLALRLDRPVGVRFFGISFPRAEGGAVSAACVQENKGAALVPGGAGVLLAFVRPDRVPPLIEAEPRAVLEAVLPTLERALPQIRGSVTRARVYRWPTGNPVFYPGYLGRLGAARTGGVEGGAPLALAGDYLVSTSVEGAVASGEAAAARLLARLAGARGGSAI